MRSSSAFTKEVLPAPEGAASTKSVPRVVGVVRAVPTSSSSRAATGPRAQRLRAVADFVLPFGSSSAAVHGASAGRKIGS